MLWSTRADFLCLLLCALAPHATHGDSASCIAQGTCEELNVTLLQRKLQLEPPQTLERQPSDKARMNLLQGGAVAHRAKLAACAKQASHAGQIAEYVTSGPLAELPGAAECVVQGSRIKRDSGEEAAGAFRAMDAQVAKALAAEPPNKLAAVVCVLFISQNVVFNRELTMVMNRTTHTMEHIIYLLKRYPDDALLNFVLLQEVAGCASSCCPELTSPVVRLGGMDVLFNALDNFKDNPDVMMSAWRGLSDHSHNALGASVIANHGGPMKGIHFVVEQLRTHPKPYLAESPLDHLSLKYEIMQIVNGLLEHDYDNTYGAAFMGEGLPKQMLYAMRVEPDLRGTQNVACDCMNWLLDRDPAAPQVFHEAGAVEALVAAVDRFRNKGDNTLWCGSTLGEAYAVVPSCSNSLVKLGQAQPAAVDEMLQFGLFDALNNVMPQFEGSVMQLKEILRQRPGAGHR